ncbi:thiamine pyrophosphate-dependent enzyme [Nocardioides campestrisoli]|uniref:thiamine pyrophosphate-dependent enzyme n=1 Tax=Nocardioides campestrisoli TaxID=2736757 RepID=UPI00163D6CA4|nr:thiamine pyrophosphate-dependent enzyme [Nocardioides campestrisoli]
MAFAPRVADLIVGALAGHGVDRTYCVAGESFLGLLDALVDSSVDVVACRHEASAAFAALADGKMTGRPGVCLVNRGPGASNAAIAVHAAHQDATPLLLVVGQVTRGDLGRDGFQEMNYDLAFADQAKGVLTLIEGGHATETTIRALLLATEGRPGPVVLVLPEDVLTELAPGGRPVPAAAPGGWVARPDEEAVREVVRRVSRARRPLLLAGGALVGARGRRVLREAAERLQVPVAVSNKHQDLVDNAHPLYAGHLHLATRPEQRELFASADLVLAVGTRLDVVTTQDRTLPAPGQSLLHVYSGERGTPGAAGQVEEMRCDPVLFLELLADCRPDAEPPPGRGEWAASLREAECQLATWVPVPDPGDGVPFGAVVASFSSLADDDAIVTLDAGNFSSWVHRYYRFGGAGSLLGLGCGAMGFGVPSGLAAALRHPARQVITFVGDGGFLMTGNELATVVQRRARLVVVISDNGSYGTIRQHQERAYPGRVVATELHNPDFVALADAFGARGIEIRDEGDVSSAVGAALAGDGPVVVSVRSSLSWISAHQRIDLKTSGSIGHHATGGNRC